VEPNQNNVNQVAICIEEMCNIYLVDTVFTHKDTEDFMDFIRDRINSVIKRHEEYYPPSQKTVTDIVTKVHPDAVKINVVVKPSEGESKETDIQPLRSPTEVFKFLFTFICNYIIHDLKNDYEASDFGDPKVISVAEHRIRRFCPFLNQVAVIFDETVWPPENPDFYENLIVIKGEYKPRGLVWTCYIFLDQPNPPEFRVSINLEPTTHESETTPQTPTHQVDITPTPNSPRDYLRWMSHIQELPQDNVDVLQEFLEDNR
jgi:hypothetical protein